MAMELEVEALAAKDTSGILVPFKYKLRSPGPNDVLIKILYCGICHSDLHQIKNDWHVSMYPMVPGHEIAGVVSAIGDKVEKFKVGDRAAIGCFVGSCRTCEPCKQDLEQYCGKIVWTYNTKLPDGSVTYGGFSTSIVADESYVVRIPDKLPLASAAPLLCAGITVYSPMKHFAMDKPGTHLGVVGLGGLGHMAVKFGKAFGLKVTVVSTSPHKEKEAKELLGADAFLVSKDAEDMKIARGSMDYIIDTVSAGHPVDPLLTLLKMDGKLVFVGIPGTPLPVLVPLLVSGRKSLSGSGIGSIKETQEMLDFCADKNVTAIVEHVSMEEGKVNEAMQRLAKSDVKYRFVVDIGKDETSKM